MAGSTWLATMGSCIARDRDPDADVALVKTSAKFLRRSDVHFCAFLDIAKFR
jgi:hypothetical protein